MFNRMEIHVVGSLFNSGVIFYLIHCDEIQTFRDLSYDNLLSFVGLFVLVFMFVGFIGDFVTGDNDYQDHHYSLPPLNTEEGRKSIRRWFKLEFRFVYIPYKLLLIIISFIIKCVKYVIFGSDNSVCDAKK